MSHTTTPTTVTKRARIGRRTAAALLTATGLTMATVPGADATDTPGINWDYVFTGGGYTVYVERYGDIISLCDTRKDGAGVRVDVLNHSTGNGVYTLETRRGAGTCDTHRAADGAPYNLREGMWYGVYSSPYYDYWLNDR